MNMSFHSQHSLWGLIYGLYGILMKQNKCLNSSTSIYNRWVCPVCTMRVLGYCWIKKNYYLYKCLNFRHFFLFYFIDKFCFSVSENKTNYLQPIEVVPINILILLLLLLSLHSDIYVNLTWGIFNEQKGLFCI